MSVESSRSKIITKIKEVIKTTLIIKVSPSSAPTTPKNCRNVRLISLPAAVSNTDLTKPLAIAVRATKKADNIAVMLMAKYFKRRFIIYSLDL